MQRQAEARGLEPIVVTHHPGLSDVAKSTFCPKARRWTAETLLSTAPLWRDRTVILLGDVVYSSSCFDQISRCDAKLAFFTVRKAIQRSRVLEYLALVFRDQDLVAKTCEEAIRNATEHHLEARLATLARLTRGCGSTVIAIQDWSRDFDRLEDVESFDEGLLDDLP